MKKMSVILAVVVLIAAILIGVMVSQKNQANTALTAANDKAAALQTQLDTALGNAATVEGELAEVKTQLEEMSAKSGTTQAEMDALVAQLSSAQNELLSANAQLSEANLKSQELTALIDTTVTEKGQVNSTLDEALKAKADLEAQVTQLSASAQLQAQESAAKLESVTKELEALKADAESKAAEGVAEVEKYKAEADQKVSDLSAQVAALTADLEKSKADLTAALTASEEAAKAAAEAPEEGQPDPALEEALKAKADLEAQVAQLTADAETKAAEFQTQLDTAKAEAETKANELTEQVALLTAEKEAAVQTEGGNKYGLGMVTKIGSVADATAEKAGTAQVNTTVASLVLDSENKIVSVTWDVQQTKIQFSLEGKPVDLPTELLTKLEKGPAYGMVKASAIGKEWNEQIAAFVEYVKGKTVDEVLSIPVYERDASHTAVPDVEELKASVSITVGDYLEALKKAADNTK